MLELGTVVEGYRIDALIGEGGMGVVYEATQLSLERKVALKLLAPQLSGDPAFRRRFQREGRIQAAIDHPNIVTVLEAGESEYGLFIAMELIRGASLKDLILGREVEVGRTLRILGQVADALDTAHEAGLIHRDIKPHNILVRVQRRDHAYLADFGVTKDRTRTGLTGTGAVVGTIDYMAPEQIRGEPPTPKVDIYSLGAVLYECLSGIVPFPKDSEVAVLYAHLADPPPALSEHRPELPGDLDAVISTAMAKNPSDRFETAGALVEAFETALDAPTKGAIKPPPPISAPADAGIREEAEPAPTPVEQPLPRTKASDQPTPPTKASDQPTPAREEPSWVLRRPRVAETTPAPPSTTVPGRPRLWVWLGAALLVVALAAVGFIVGRGGKSEAKPSAPSNISVQGVGLRLPAGWHRLAHPARVPGVTYPGAFTVGPLSGSVRLVAARTKGVWPTLLPAAFEDRAQSQAYLLARQDVVRLGKREAFRYHGLKLNGVTGTVTAFVLPSNGKVELLSCVGPAAAAALGRRCEGVAATVELAGSGRYSLTPDSGYAHVLGRSIRRLNQARATGRKKLANADKPSAQARAARVVAGVFALEGRLLAKQKTELLVTPVNRRIVSALHGVQSAYTALAAAASNNAGAAYSAARASIRAREAKLRSALADLRLVGISVT